MNYNRGQSVIELLVAISIFVMAMAAAFQLFFGGQTILADTINANLAYDYAQEGIEATLSIRDRNWDELTDGAHGLVFQNNEWMFGSSSIDDARDIFTRTVEIQTIDANTKIATTTISWEGDSARIQKLKFVEYLTKWSAPLTGGCSAEALSGDWTRPQTLGSGDLGPGNEGTDVVVKLPYVYMSGVASSANKPDVFVFDVSNPSAPSLAASLNIGADGINALYLKGNYLYGASGNDAKELIIFNISNPANISEAGSLNLSGDLDALSISGIGDVVYLGRVEDGSGDELIVIDVSNPASPSILTSFNIGDDVNDVLATSEKLYLVSEESNKDLWIYDITTPTSPTLLVSHDLQQGGELNSVHFELKDTVLVGDTSNTFFTLGATTTDIYVRDSIGTGGSVNDIICVADNLAFLATSNSTKEFLIINIADPDNITEYASLNYPQLGTGIDFADNKVFMSVRSNDSLRIITSSP